MKHIYITKLLVFVWLGAFCQNKYGHQWYFTNHNIMDFRGNYLRLDIILPTPFYDVGDFCSNICDKETGDYVFSTGGCYIKNKKFAIMKNGDSINSKIAYGSWCRVGQGDGTFPMYQNNVSLPYPDSDNKYLMYNLDFDTLTVSGQQILFPRNLYQNTIDMNGDNGMGEVVEKKKIILTDTLCNGGYLTATRHKNEKDWWLIVPEWRTSCYYIIPVTSKGAGLPQKQCLGLQWGEEDRGGQVDISPDGTKYARVNKRDTIVVFDFNKETGQFSNPITLYQPNKEDFLQGVCLSSNNRFLYVMHIQTVYQFDLQADNVQESMQIIADIKPLMQNGIKGQFQFSRLAPDGKIYISSPFNHLFLSVINRPNCAGSLCDFRPYGVELKFYNWGAIPNNPHFMQPPANYSCDSIPSGVQDVSENVTLSPNPTSSILTISSTAPLESYTVTHITGQKVLVGKINNSTQDIDVSTLSDGIYFIQFLNISLNTSAVGKFVVKR